VRAAIGSPLTQTNCHPFRHGRWLFGVSDGSSLWATRYATEGRARSLFASADIDSLHQMYPEMWFAAANSSDRLIASEPFSDLPGVWHEIDESSAVIVRSGGVLEHEPLHPQVPRATVSSSR